MVPGPQFDTTPGKVSCLVNDEKKSDNEISCKEKIYATVLLTGFFSSIAALGYYIFF